MTAYGSVYLCKLFVPLWSILCRDHFHTKFLSLTSCSTYQACSSVKITQILHQNVGSQRRPWCFFHQYIIKASYTKLFCLGTQPSQFIKVLNSGILLPYQHVKHKINLTLRPGITFTFLKFLHVVDTNSWRHLL